MKTFWQLVGGQRLGFIRKESEAQNAYTFFFEKEGLVYEAGQHFMLELKHQSPDKRGSMRVFSASSAPSEEYLSFTTRCFDQGSSTFKQALMQLKSGDQVMVRGPSPISDVYKVQDYARPHVYIAGGIGITPFRSVLTDTLARSKDLRGALFYANRDKDFIFGQELEQGIDRLPNFVLHKVVSPDRILADSLRVELQKWPQAVFIVSGTISFVEHYAGLLEKEVGVAKSQIRAYKYRGIFGSSY